MTDGLSTLRAAGARHLVTRNLRVRPGENAVSASRDHTIPLATTVVDAIRPVGGRTLHIHEAEEA